MPPLCASREMDRGSGSPSKTETWLFGFARVQRVGFKVQVKIYDGKITAHRYSRYIVV